MEVGVFYNIFMSYLNDSVPITLVPGGCRRVKMLLLEQIRRQERFVSQGCLRWHESVIKELLESTYVRGRSHRDNGKPKD